MYSEVFRLILEAFGEVDNLGPALKNAVELGDKQATVRDGVIQTINELADALVLASDLIAQELSGTVIEFHTNMMDETLLKGCFKRLAARVSEPSLRLLLHEGKVCGSLHKLGDRFRQPLTYSSMSGLSVWDEVKTFFGRSNSMDIALNGLLEGEQDYLHDLADFLNDVGKLAEEGAGTAWGQEELLKQSALAIIKLVQEKRQTLLDKAREVRQKADIAIATLH